MRAKMYCNRVYCNIGFGLVRRKTVGVYYNIVFRLRWHRASAAAFHHQHHRALCARFERPVFRNLIIVVAHVFRDLSFCSYPLNFSPRPIMLMDENLIQFSLHSGYFYIVYKNLKNKCSILFSS